MYHEEEEEEVAPVWAMPVVVVDVYMVVWWPCFFVMSTMIRLLFDELLRDQHPLEAFAIAWACVLVSVLLTTLVYYHWCAHLDPVTLTPCINTNSRIFILPCMVLQSAVEYTIMLASPDQRLSLPIVAWALAIMFCATVVCCVHTRLVSVL